MSLEVSLPSTVHYSAAIPHAPENVNGSLMTILPTNGNAFKSGSVISFDLPARAGLYLDGKTAFLRYRLTYTSGATAPILRATPAVVPFFKLDEYVNSTTVNSVYNYGQVANMYINTHLGVSEKYAVQSALFGELKAGVNGMDTQDSTTLAASQAALAGILTLATPLYCSALMAADKMIPTGLLGSWRIQLTLAQIVDMVSVAANMTDYQIDNVELCINAVDLGMAVDSAVASQGDNLMIKTTCWANAGQSVASGAVGMYSLPFNHRYQSINNLYLLSSGTTVASDVNGIYDSRDITSQNGSFQFTIGSQTYPQLPINTKVNKTGALNYLRECASSLADWRYSMSIDATEFSCYLGSLATSSPTPGFTAIAATTVTEPSKFYVGVPVSKLQASNPYAATSLLSGVSAAATPIIANISIGTACGQAYNVYMVAEYDALISFNPMSRQVNVVA